MTLFRSTGVDDLCHIFVKSSRITSILVSFDSARRALSNGITFVYQARHPYTKVQPSIVQSNIFRLRNLIDFSCKILYFRLWLVNLSFRNTIKHKSLLPAGQKCNFYLLRCQTIKISGTVGS